MEMYLIEMHEIHKPQKVKRTKGLRKHVLFRFLYLQLHVPLDAEGYLVQECMDPACMVLPLPIQFINHAYLRSLSA